MPHAEIAGAGLAGLTAGLLLARSGWTVQVHERASAVREPGAGILITDNGLLVLEELQLMPKLASLGSQLKKRQMISGDGRILQESDLSGPQRAWNWPRQALIDTLYQAALAVGVRVVTDSRVSSVDPAGTLRLESGAALRADLIVGADGYRSTVRAAAGLGRHMKQLNTTSVRFLLAGRRVARELITKQYWSGHRRMMVAPCGEDNTYVYLACRDTDVAAVSDPGWHEAWLGSLPSASNVLAELSEYTPYIAPYTMVEAGAWSIGRVALIGDAAHAMPPTLGQGANLAMVNARSMTTFLSKCTEDQIPEALSRWAARVRPSTDYAQRWSYRYDRASTRWPRALAFARSQAISLLGRWPALDRHMRASGSIPPVTR